MPHRKKHTMRWLRSILAVVLSCLLLCSLLCLYVLHVLERTVVETNTALTAYVQKSVDTRLEELHRYSTTIEITHANTLLKNLRELPGTLPAQAYQLSVTLRDFLVTNKLARAPLCRPQETSGTFGLSIPYRIRAGILPPIPRSSRKRAYWRAVRQAALSLTRFLEAAPPDLQRKALTAAISALN